jgi:hypothetical protein
VNRADCPVRTLSDQVASGSQQRSPANQRMGTPSAPPLTEPTWQHGAGRHLIKPKKKKQNAA